MKKKHLFIGIGSALGVISATFISLFVWKSVTSGKTPTEHFVTFESYGGTHIDSQRVEDGKTATLPSVTPTRGDDTFLGWFTDFEKEYTFNEPVTKDITLYAGWDVAPEPKTTHSFKFTGTDCSVNGFKEFNCNVLIGEQPQFEIVPDDKCLIPDNITVVKGQNVSYTKENGHGYIKITNMTSDIEITASAVSINYYTFSFTSETCTIDGQHTFTKEGIQEGTTTTFTILPDAGHMLPETIEIPEEVKSFATYQNGVITITNMSGDVTLSNVVAPAKTYTVTWLDYDGKTIQTDEVVDGGAPTKPDDPIRQSSDPYIDYKFKGWVPEISEEVHSNQTYIATYETVFYKDAEAYMHINVANDGKKFEFKCTATSNIDIKVDWGDGTPQEPQPEGTISHTYETKGEYNVRILNPITTISASGDKTLIKELYLGKNITSIGGSAFYGCSQLQTITFEEGSQLTSIGERAFDSCSSLASIIIPSSVTSIGSNAFDNCSAITILKVDPANVTYTSQNGSGKECNAIITKDGKTLVFGCKTTTIPSNVTSIGSYAFCNCTALAEITIPSSVTSIGGSAFNGCSQLQTITFEEGSQLTSIGSMSFFDCNKLSVIIIPISVTKIDDFAFVNCNSLIICCEAESEPGSWGQYWNLSRCPCYWGYINKGIQDGLSYVATKTGSYITKYEGTETAINIPNVLGGEPVISIDDEAFKDCSDISTITFEEGSQLTSIGKSVFAGCSALTGIAIPSSVTEIGGYAFYGCSQLQTITFEEGSQLTSIGERAFYNCSALTGIAIPSSVTEIGGYAFYGCSQLQTITFEEGSQLTSIGESVFAGCSAITRIAIPSSVTSIGNSAFSGCSALTRIAIPSSVTEIGEYAFYDCSQLQTVTFDEESQLDSIGKRAFEFCSALTGIAIPSSVTSIGIDVFNNCSQLQTVTFDEESQLMSIGGGAFYDCSALTEITIPSSVTEIGNDAFRLCYNLQTVDLTALDTPPTLGVSAFDYCPDNLQIYVKAGLVETFKAADGWKDYATKIVPGPVPSINII